VYICVQKGLGFEGEEGEAFVERVCFHLQHTLVSIGGGYGIKRHFFRRLEILGRISVKDLSRLHRSRMMIPNIYVFP